MKKHLYEIVYPSSSGNIQYPSLYLYLLSEVNVLRYKSRVLIRGASFKLPELELNLKRAYCVKIFFNYKPPK